MLFLTFAEICFAIAAAPPTTGISMSPPFVLSIAASSTGLIAATTADGRVWLGTGADKASPAASEKKKRSRKWEGLRESSGIFTQVADGPVVARCVQQNQIASVADIVFAGQRIHRFRDVDHLLAPW